MHERDQPMAAQRLAHGCEHDAVLHHPAGHCDILARARQTPGGLCHGCCHTEMEPSGYPARIAHCGEIMEQSVPQWSPVDRSSSVSSCRVRLLAGGMGPCQRLERHRSLALVADPGRMEPQRRCCRIEQAAC